MRSPATGPSSATWTATARPASASGGGRPCSATWTATACSPKRRSRPSRETCRCSATSTGCNLSHLPVPARRPSVAVGLESDEPILLHVREDAVERAPAGRPVERLDDVLLDEDLGERGQDLFERLPEVGVPGPGGRKVRHPRQRRGRWWLRENRLRRLRRGEKSRALRRKRGVSSFQCEPERLERADAGLVRRAKETEIGLIELFQRAPALFVFLAVHGDDR